MPHIDKGRASTRSSAIPTDKRLNERSFFSYSEGETVRSFSLRFAAGAALAFASVLFSPEIVVASYYSAAIIALIIGLVNAFIPFLLSAASFERSLVAQVAASFIVTLFILYIFSIRSIGIGRASLQSLLLLSITISILTWFVTLALKRSSE